ncbi:hypothetical protein BC830DRAFT_1063912 [Chytriomyces sp. MP71]|nr:hypothetical protein BC830DRAFT_1063912 [Chytriomyces sp. MP71]
MAQPATHITSIARHAYITKTPLWQQRDALSRKSGPHATVYMVNGDRYLGEWLANKKHGNGTYFYNSTGSIYEGEWANDMRNGFGTFAMPIMNASAEKQNGNGTKSRNKAGSPTGADVAAVLETAVEKAAKREQHHAVAARDEALLLRKVYAGEWKHDKREGKGTYFYEDGSWYEGMWANDQKDGWGRMNYIDGAVYEGEWHKEMRHGQGILLSPSGDRYEGMWLDDAKEGPGKFIYKTKRQLYEGEWSKGLPKCGILVDLPPLPGQLPRKYPIPEIKLADANGVLEHQREELRETRITRMMRDEA